MDSNYVLEIQFLSFREKPEINKLKFNGQIYDVTLDTVNEIVLPEAFFEEDESKNSSIKLFKNSELVNECILEILKGVNYFYCFLDEKGYTFQLLFIHIQPTIKIPLYKEKYYNIIKYDSNKTVNRKRYTFINANFFSILINEKYFTIQSFAPDLKSYQFCVYDLEKKLIVSRPLLLEEKDNFKLSYLKLSSLAFEFKNAIVETFDNKNLNQIKSCLKNFKKLENITFYLNKSKTKLSNIFDNDLYIYFYINISLYIFITLFQNNSSIKQIIEYYLKKANEINENKSMKIYQKVLLIERFISLLYECKSFEEIIKADFTYYLMEKKEDNSVLDLVEKFFKEYREKLTEESPVFLKLIELDGDSGIYNNDSFYCFNMQNLDELRSHLKEIETNIFVTHDLYNNNLANTDINSGIVSVNIHYINQFKTLNLPLDKALTEETKETGEIIASKIVYYLLHEINGHKKFLYNKNKRIKSPTKFIENGNIFTLCPKSSVLQGENIIKIVPDNTIGEDGYFYELIYGKIIDYYTFEIIDNVNDFSDLLYEVDLWVNNFEQLREYFKFKYYLEKFGVNFKSKKLTIKEKINDYKNECMKVEKEKKIYIDTLFKKDKPIKYKRKKISNDFNKSIYSNPQKEKSEIEESGNEFNSSKDNEKMNDKGLMVSEKDEEENLEMEEEIGEEKESESEEKTEKEMKISEKEKEKIIMQLPDESLLSLKQLGVLSEVQYDIFKEKRRKYVNKCVKCPSIIDNNT